MKMILTPATAPELQERLKWGHLVYFNTGPVPAPPVRSIEHAAVRAALAAT